MRLWRTQEINGVLAALVHAYDVLPWYARWFLGGWQKALLTLGFLMKQRAEFEEQSLGIEYKVWDIPEIQLAIASIYDDRKPGWDGALAAAALALCGQQERVLAPPTVGLDPEVWREA